MRLVPCLLLALCLVTGVATAQHWVVDLPGTFVDISTTGGTMIAAPADDSEHNILTTLGNAAWPAGNLRIGNNGAVSNHLAVVPAGDVGLTNAVILPGVAVPAGLPTGAVAVLCPFWDDLDTLTAGGTSIWWQETTGGLLYIMWKNEGHFSDAAGQSITFEIVVDSTATGGPCSPYVQFIYSDAVFGGTQAAFDEGLSATVGYVAGTVGGGLSNAPHAFNTRSVFGSATAGGTGLVLSLVPGGPAVPFGVVITAPGGPGSIQLDIVGSQFCTNGTYFMPVTLAPTGPAWFFGLSISLAELISQFNTGAPFVGPVPTTIGPFSSLPPLTIYGTVIGWPSGGPAAPVVVGAPFVYTI